MTREQWKDWFEIVGIVAIVGSLVFVGLEVRQNTLAVQDSSHQTSLVMSHDSTEKLWDTNFAATYENGIRSYSNLDGAEKRQFDQYVAQRINIWEYAFAARERGVMTEELWQSWDRFFSVEMQQESWRDVWRSRNHGYSNPFNAHVEAVISGN